MDQSNTTPIKKEGSKTSFWDFKLVKAYRSTKEKVLDFLVGLFIFPTIMIIIYFVLIYILNNIPFFNKIFVPLYWIWPIGTIIINILLIGYFKKKRKYISSGLIGSFVIVLVAVGGCFTWSLSGWSS